MKRFLRIRNIVILLIIAVIGFGIFSFVKSKNANPPETTTIQRGNVAEELILTGEIKAEEHTNLRFQTSGELSWLGIKEGDSVTKGQTLARLDTANLAATLGAAEEDLRAADATLLRVYDDVKGNDEAEPFDIKEDRVTAEAARNKAYRAYTIAQKNLANASLKAPFNGIITSLTYPYAGVNTLLSESQIEIVNPKTIYFEVDADQSEVIDLKLGQKVNIVLDSFLKETFEGNIYYISITPKEGSAGVVYKVKAAFTNQNVDALKYRVGMTGDGRFVLSEKTDALWVPSNFVHSDTNGKYVNLSRKNNKTYIEVGAENEDRVEIIGDGIAEGLTVYD